MEKNRSDQGERSRPRQVDDIDRAFHEALSDTLTEWASSEDEEAFQDL